MYEYSICRINCAFLEFTIDWNSLCVYLTHRQSQLWLLHWPETLKPATAMGNTFGFVCVSFIDCICLLSQLLRSRATAESLRPPPMVSASASAVASTWASWPAPHSSRRRTRRSSVRSGGGRCGQFVGVTASHAAVQVDLETVGAAGVAHHSANWRSGF